MCLVVVAFRHHPDYPLVVVANRDEFYDRPAESAQFWEDHPTVLAGRDMEAGGTWFGVNRHGHWATVTNYRGGGMGDGLRSRGDLPTEFLTASADNNTPHLSPLNYANNIIGQSHHFRGFSLLTGNLDTLAYCSNANLEANLKTPLEANLEAGAKTNAALQTLDPGVYTLSNDVLDTPWPKAEYARKQLTAVLNRSGPLDAESLLAILGSRERFPDHQLPGYPFVDEGLDLEMERTLSPPFIVSDSYGTRCTTVLMIDAQGQATFAEQSYHQGQATERKDYSFEIVTV